MRLCDSCVAEIQNCCGLAYELRSGIKSCSLSKWEKTIYMSRSLQWDDILASEDPSGGHRGSSRSDDDNADTEPDADISSDLKVSLYY